jgi:hypothetical protein
MVGNAGHSPRRLADKAADGGYRTAMTDRPATRPADRPESKPDQADKSRKRLPALGRPAGAAGADLSDLDEDGDFADEHNEAWVSEEPPEGVEEPESPEGHSGLEPTHRPY